MTRRSQRQQRRQRSIDHWQRLAVPILLFGLIACLLTATVIGWPMLLSWVGMVGTLQWLIGVIHGPGPSHRRRSSRAKENRCRHRQQPEDAESSP